MLRLLLTLTLITFAFCDTNFTIGSNVRNPRVIDSNVARSGQIQSIASIRRVGVLTGNLGGGTVIHITWILTAASVIAGLRANEVSAALGILDYSRPAINPGITVFATELRPHPNFNPNGPGGFPNNNIALIRTTLIPCVFNFISTAHLEPRTPPPDFVAVAAGWGPSTAGREPNTVLRFRTISPAPAAGCPNLPTTEFCMESAICASDVGGPLITGAGLIGVASFENCGAMPNPVPTPPAGIPDRYVRIGPFHDWILGSTGALG